MPIRKTAGALALTALLAAVPAHAGYLTAEWGMTPEQVVATSNGSIAAVREEKDKRIQGKLRLAAGKTEIDGITYELDYFFDPKTKKLVAINFVPPKERCDDAAASHTARFGAPTEKRKVIPLDPRKPPLVQVEYEWSGGMGLGGDRVSGVDVSVKEMDIRYCQFLRSK